jgi:hypothetical protein
MRRKRKRENYFDGGKISERGKTQRVRLNKEDGEEIGDLGSFRGFFGLLRARSAVQIV